MKESLHPLSAQILGIRATLTPFSLALTNSILPSSLPERFSGLEATLPAISQAIVILLIELFLYNFVVYMNNRHRLKQIKRLENQRCQLEAMLPNLSEEDSLDAIDGISKINKRIIELHTSATDVTPVNPEEAKATS